MTREKRATSLPEEAEGRKITENIRLGPDGVYRWTYAYSMLRNPTILLTVYKVLGMAFGVVYLFSLIVSLIDRSIRTWSDLWGLSKGFVLLFAVFIVIGAIAYFIVAAVYGWKYIVNFEMTEEYVKHIPTPEQFRKAQKLGRITVLVGLFAKRPTTVGAGMLAASCNESTSVFKDVEIVKVRRRRHTIHVDYLLDKNQVYAEDADFAFVEKFILDRCVKAKIR